jgi:hypothetical protein
MPALTVLTSRYTSLCSPDPGPLPPPPPSQMLRTAVGAVCTLRFGDMHAAVGAAMAAADFYTHPSLVSMLACLGSDLGLTEERDLSLVSAMAQLNLAADRDCLALLPAAGATLFASAVYDHSTYLPRIGAFEGNEHLVQVALAKLFSVFFKLGGLGGLNTGVGGDDEGGKGAVGVGVGVVANRQQERERYQTYVEQYVRFSSQILLKQREEVQGAKGGLRPTRTMGAMLEYFTTLCPVTTRGCLDRSLPNSLLNKTKNSSLLVQLIKILLINVQVLYQSSKIIFLWRESIGDI